VIRSRWGVVVGLLVATFTFAGCGGRGASGGAIPGAIPGAPDRPSFGPSGDLIYAAKRNVVYLFTYPAGKHVAQFVPPNAVDIRGLCSDTSGNVFVAANGSVHGSGVVYEYAHGSTSPTRTLSLTSGFDVTGCAVDPQSAVIAVALNEKTQGQIALYSNPSGDPHFTNISPYRATSLTYKDSTDIIAWTDTGLILIKWKLGDGWRAGPIYIPRKTKNHGRYVQWTGKRLALLIRSPAIKSRIRRLRVVGEGATIRGTTTFKDLGRGSGIGFCVQGSRILLPMGEAKNKSSIGIYPYPAGGEPETVIKGYDADLLTVSVSSSRTRSLR